MRNHAAGRSLTVFSDDTYIVSYPRSGNTWTRFLIGNLLHSTNPVDFTTLEKHIPEIHLTSDRVMRRLPHPRILKSHDCFDPRYKNVIYVVRDPRDVAVSAYYYSIKRQNISDDYPIDEFVTRFVRGEFFDYCGSWSEHVTAWLAVRGSVGKKLLLLRYEDISEEPERELAKIAEFLGFRAGPDELKHAVQLSTAERMRALEKQQASQWILTRSTRQDIPFVRTANHNCWKNALPERCVSQIESVWHELMVSLGYPVTQTWTSAKFSMLQQGT